MPSATTTQKVASIINKKPEGVATTTKQVPSTPATQAPSSTSTNKMEGEMKKQNITEVPNKISEYETIVNESEDLVTALESVCKMCGLTEENVMCDDTLDTIKVQGDTIFAPSVSPVGKTAAVIKSVSAVLDYISQRINQKIGDFQFGNIEKGRLADHIANDANPAKGKVIGRHIDPDGNEVLVYDSGLVDMANTVTAQQFVNELRANGVIPEIKTTDSTVPQKQDISYFTAEDDITNGIETPASNGGMTEPAMSNTNAEPMQPTQGASDYGDSGAGVQAQTGGEASYDNNVVDSTQYTNEAANILDMVAKRHDTNHLGYDIFSEMGFSFVKPIDFFMEAASKGKGGKKQINPSDIKHLKFDNSHIHKAIKLMNEVRAEQDFAEGKHFNLEKMVNNPKWNQAVKELETQFDCHLDIRFVNDKRVNESGGGYTTYFSDEFRAKCHVSKSKGFQLNGMPILIVILNSFMTTYSPTDQNLWGQFVISIFLHEIFHNISAVLRTYNTEFSTMLSTTMTTAAMTKSAKVRRKLMTNFVEAAEKSGFIKMNPIKKKAYIKNLLYLCSAKENMANMKAARTLIEKGDSDLLDDYIKRAEAIIKQRESYLKGTGFALYYMLLGGIEGGITGWAFVQGEMALGFFALSMLMLVVMSAAVVGSALSMERKEVEDRKSGKTKTFEEHYADMFATMYSLPPTLFSYAPSKMVAATMTDDQIKRIHKIEQAQVNLFGDVHPPTSERNAASVKYAQQLLSSGAKINPDVKKYLEWVVANHKKILEVEDIDNLYSKSTFDPKTAENIDLHIQNLISDAGIEIKEQAIAFLFSNGDEVIA